MLRHGWATPGHRGPDRRIAGGHVHYRTFAGMLRSGGFSVDLAPPRSTRSADHARASPRSSSTPAPSGRGPRVVALTARRMAGQYPKIAAICCLSHDGATSWGPGCDDQFEFEFALDLVLDGLERRRGRRGARGRRPSTSGPRPLRIYAVGLRCRHEWTPSDDRPPAMGTESMKAMESRVHTARPTRSSGGSRTSTSPWAGDDDVVVRTRASVGQPGRLAPPPRRGRGSPGGAGGRAPAEVPRPRLRRVRRGPCRRRRGHGAFAPGDEVFGSPFMRGFGAFAEYVARPPRTAWRPSRRTSASEQAGAVPLAHADRPPGPARPRAR